MKQIGFEFEMYETMYEDCFIDRSMYANGNLKLSLYGKDLKNSNTDYYNTEHLAEITLDQDIYKLPLNEVIVDNHFKPSLIPQLQSLGIIKDMLCMCYVKGKLYPKYSLNMDKVIAKSFKIPNLVAA